MNKDKWVISSTSAGPTMASPPQQWLWLTSWELWRDNREKWSRLWDLSGQATRWDRQWWSTVVQGLGEQVRWRDKNLLLGLRAVLYPPCSASNCTQQQSWCQTDMSAVAAAELNTSVVPVSFYHCFDLVIQKLTFTDYTELDGATVLHLFVWKDKTTTSALIWWCCFSGENTVAGTCAFMACMNRCM